MYGPRRQNITKLLSLELMIAGWCLWCCKSSPNQLPDVTCPNRASAVEHCRLQVVHPLSVQPTGSAPPLPIPMIRGCRSGLGYQSTGGRPISNHLKSWCREGAAARLPWLEYLRKMWRGMERETGMDETDRQPPPSDVTGSGRAAAAAVVRRWEEWQGRREKNRTWLLRCRQRLLSG